ncbi:polysulfide reductase NrfD [Halobacteria archaeon AArc-m2/3/4]|uniref:Polysulfide reductase NrfD n=1 Tax=Natronoglomus mannanivorans TaxID=2979990 RepID=A0AAP2Z0R7_9EURY|nr:polysulfide reductase NrfD [Halobacteria archaeon AArc-xg1-1]MCU4973904.1 polysulfide reductase NrfD [Halobacteria archaeon AArc-m2/3/4]
MSTDTDTPSEADILRPIRSTSKAYYALLAVVSVAIGLFLVGWGLQLRDGMIVTNLADWGSGGGVTWGLYIGAFIWWVGIAHGGIILSAAVRLLGMDRYKPVARLAELLTIAGLTAAGLYIIIHVGRPDRIVTSILLNYNETIHTSPLVWDVTVITLYFVMTATYLGLTLRYDITRLRDQLPDRFEPLYRLMTIGYTEKEDEVVERMVWWLALGIIILAPLLLHGGVIPWLFALIPSMPGWFGAIQGPQFLTIALTSAIGGVLIISYAFRKAYGWDHIITDDVFRGLLLWLGFFSLLFLWLQLQQIMSGVFAAPIDQTYATDAKLSHPVYWIAMGLVATTLAYIFAQTLRPSLFSLRRSVLAGGLILTATLLEKIFFVVEGLMYPTFGLYDAVPGSYFPSVIEMISIVGTIGIVTLFFMVVAKVVPVVELHAIEEHGDHDHEGDGEREYEFDDATEEPTDDHTTEANPEVNA